MYQNIYIGRAFDDQEPFVYLWDDKEGLLKLPYRDYDYAYKKDESGDMVSLFGERVRKVKRYEETSDYLEYDVPRDTRVLVDRYLNEDLPSEGHTVLFFDIEVSMEEGRPDPMTGNQPITAISYQDDRTNEEVVLLLDTTGKAKNYEFDNAKVFPFRDERDLLSYFLDQYETIAPTIITGWNSDGFDVPYLYNRIKNVLGKREASRLSPIRIVKYSPHKEKYSIAGVSSLDYMLMYKKFTYTEQPTYRLDYIGRLEVGLGKVEYEGTLDTLFNTDPAKFVEYSLTDIRIVRKLDDKLKFIDLVRDVCSLGHIPYEKFWFTTAYIEGTILAYLHRKGVVASNKPRDGRAKMDELKESGEKGFEGAFVKDPVPGRYDWVYSLDLQSLYPSVIMTLNISPETKVGRVANWNPIDHLENKMSEYVISDLNENKQNALSKTEFMDFMESSKFALSSNGVIYRQDKRGVIPEVLDKWFSERLEFRKLMKKYKEEGDEAKSEFYNKRQHIQKILLNAIYGSLGLPVFRFYDIDNAQAVTLSSQDVIKMSGKFVQNKYQKLIPDVESHPDYIIYQDTDSCYVSAMAIMPKDFTEEEKKAFTIKTAKDMEKSLNEFYTPMAKRLFFVSTHRLHIKGESVSRSALWTRKKRYAMRIVYDLENNLDVEKLKITGLDVVRSSFPPAFQRFTKEILGDILDNATKEQVDEKILNFKDKIPEFDLPDITRNSAVNNITKFESSVEEGSLSEFITGTPAHVKAAISYNRLLKYFNSKRGQPILDGEKVRWVYLKANPLMLSEVAFKGYGDPKPIIEFIKQHVDYDKLFESELKNKVEVFYDALAWGKISTDINQNAQAFFSF